MLKGIDPLLDADLLSVLAAAGHGDEIVLVDRNFPAASVARRLVRASGHSVTTVAAATFSVLPIDTYVDPPLWRMEVVGAPDEVPAVASELLGVAEGAEGRRLAMGSLERIVFYERAARAFAVVATGESRPYGNLIVSTGVVPATGS